jgi:3-phosphoshikimate 1-carboxyvinyltransferase
VWVVPDEGDVLTGGLGYPEQFEIRPYAGPPLSATVSVPGSKSITNRALVLTAVAGLHDDVALTGALRSEDTGVMIDCLRVLGYTIETHWDLPEPLVLFLNRRTPDSPPRSADLFVANSGTTMRFLTALVATREGRYRLDGVPRMRERPVQDLLNALNQINGVRAYSELQNGFPPVVVECGARAAAGLITVRADISSQFLSALLMVAPRFATEDLWATVRVEGPLVSEPYVEMTLRMMRAWGQRMERPAHNTYSFAPTSMGLDKGMYAIEPDASAASYFWAAAAILGGRVTVSGLIEHSLQGDVRFVDLLQQMGCRIENCDSGITVYGGSLRGIDVDMNDISDTVMTLAAVACFADGPTRIRNVAHIRHKETDRIAALATELIRLGAEVEVFADGLSITPRPMHGAEVETYNDHRMAMSVALIGLKVPGVMINNPGCVAKTYPRFWDDLDKMFGGGVVW